MDLQLRAPFKLIGTDEEETRKPSKVCPAPLGHRVWCAGRCHNVHLANAVTESHKTESPEFRAASAAKCEKGTPPDVAAMDKHLVGGILWTAGAKWSVQIFTWLNVVIVARFFGTCRLWVGGDGDRLSRRSKGNKRVRVRFRRHQYPWTLRSGNQADQRVFGPDGPYRVCGVLRIGMAARTILSFTTAPRGNRRHEHDNSTGCGSNGALLTAAAVIPI